MNEFVTAEALGVLKAAGRLPRDVGDTGSSTPPLPG
jgi:hypothetical protein